MNKLEIEAFLSVCRHKNISKAAEELFINQSSLSTRIKALEDRLGCPLLLRGKGKREITLTEQGQAFYNLALQYSEITDKMLSVGKSSDSDELRISAINSVGNYMLPAVFRRFIEKHPHIRLTVQDMEAEMATASIIRGRTDIAFSTGKVETDQIVATPFMREPYVILCSEDSSYPETVSPEELAPWNEVYIKWSAEYRFWHQSVFGENPHNFTLELMGQIYLFVSQPEKWAIVPKSIADVICASTGLRQCTPDFQIPDRSLYLLRHRDTAESVSIRNFLDTVHEVMEQQYGKYLLI
ncbi:MAG: LysR family transcriptional regulator [Firmicutes bacterium]|nr:LysR family transcriptional regulator [Bacillota bacterium]